MDGVIGLIGLPRWSTFLVGWGTTAGTPGAFRARRPFMPRGAWVGLAAIGRAVGFFIGAKGSAFLLGIIFFSGACVDEFGVGAPFGVIPAGESLMMKSSSRQVRNKRAAVLDEWS